MLISKENIKKLMEERGVNVLGLEKKTGINRNTLYSILYGQSKNPSHDKVKAIAEGLGVSLESLYVRYVESDKNALTEKQIRLIIKITDYIGRVIIKYDIQMPFDKIINKISKAYHYSSKPPMRFDKKFADSVIDEN